MRSRRTRVVLLRRKFYGSSFNGIIYVTATWPNSLTGFGTGEPAEYPVLEGSATDANQIATLHGANKERSLILFVLNNSAAGHPGMKATLLIEIQVNIDLSCRLCKLLCCGNRRLPECRKKYLMGRL